MISKVQPQNGHGSNTLETKIQLNDVLWSAGNSPVENEDDALADDELWADKHTEKLNNDVQSEDGGAESQSDVVEDLLTNEGEEGSNACTHELEKPISEDTPLLGEVAVELEEANDSDKDLPSLETTEPVVISVQDPGTSNDDEVEDESNETSPLSEDRASLVFPQITGRPALRGGSPFNSSFTVRSEPCSPNPALFPRLRKADAMASLTSPGKRSHDESSSSASGEAESTTKRLCRNWLPAGLTRWWQGEENQPEENKANCLLM